MRRNSPIPLGWPKLLAHEGCSKKPGARQQQGRSGAAQGLALPMDDGVDQCLHPSEVRRASSDTPKGQVSEEEATSQH